ncbi:MAG: right-handed parallel beta-helix repeat-containing protein [Terrimonas sp.]|nr:right-handed parallel beta-helix repeat-containing protein [Terrimonas sp.]
MKIVFTLVFLFAAIANAQTIHVTDYGVQPNSFADATGGVQKAIEDCRKHGQSTIVFPEGRYDFWTDNAVETRYYISNTSSEIEVPEKKQRAGLFFKNLKNITIEANNAVFVFHGKMITWVIDSCENISIRNVSVNYERPGMSEMTIKAITPTSVTAAIHPDSKFAIINGKLEWYGEKWITRNFHAVLVRPEEGTLFYSNWAPFLNSKAEVIAPLTVQFTGDFSTIKARPGDVLTVRDRYRDYVGVFHNRSKNISLFNVKMHSMHGLGIVSQFCENLSYDSVFVEPAADRMIASSADGMHFSGCKGQITINHCRFRGMHDDPVNVHGTHLKVTEIISPVKLKLRFMHHQTYGFPAFATGDSVAFLHAAALQIFGTGVVRSASLISEREMIVEMQQPFTDKLKEGDALENITWTPSLTIQNSRFEGTNTRGTLVTTRRKVLIENNVYYRTGMNAILIGNDASDWYESGPVTDVTIRNNQFIECGYNSGSNNYIINISPEAQVLEKGYYVHRNRKIENNYFKVYDYPVLRAYSTKELVFSNNTIERSDFMTAGNKRPSSRLIACTAVKIDKNIFKDDEPEIEVEKMKRKDVRTDIKKVLSDVQ